jgi:hypothetical protein
VVFVLGNCRLRGGQVPCGVVPLFRSRNRFSIPTLRLGPVIIAAVLGLVIAGLVALAVLEPRPPLRHFEVPVPNERLAR